MKWKRIPSKVGEHHQHEGTRWIDRAERLDQTGRAVEHEKMKMTTEL